MSFDSGMFAQAMFMLILCCVLIGVAVGGVLFEVLPWVYHHLNIHWS